MKIFLEILKKHGPAVFAAAILGYILLQEMKDSKEDRQYNIMLTMSELGDIQGQLKSLTETCKK